MDILDIDPTYSIIKSEILKRQLELEKHFGADVIFFYGEITPQTVPSYRSLIENLQPADNKKNKLVIFLNTPGGQVETVEKYVDINHYFYEEIYFVVPDEAMSAGTVFCMSGDKIYMDYSSSLGPIDPQVFNGERYVPALGYLDKVNEYMQKAASGQSLNAVELFFLQRQDIAFLRQCEQQSNLTINLIQEWLEKYKFKNWNTHKNTGQKVTLDEKKNQAKLIAKELGNNSKWFSHSRSISIEKLNNMGLVIDDYSENIPLKKLIRGYNDLILSFIQQNNIPFLLNSRLYL